MNERIRPFLSARAAALEAAIEVATRQGMPPGTISASYLMARLEKSLAARATAPNEELARAWALRVREARDGGSILSDHVWSLACEQREDLRVPDFDPGRANACAARVLERNMSFITRYVQKNFGADGVDVDAVVSTAFGRLYEAYWSPQATCEFQGDAQITSAWITTARRIAREEIRARPPVEPIEDRDDPRSEPSAPPAGGLIEILDEEMRLHYQDCLETLPPTQRMIAFEFWEQDRSNSEIAAKYSSKPSAVAMNLHRARANLADCMAGKGYSRWEAAKKERDSG